MNRIPSEELDEMLHAGNRDPLHAELNRLHASLAHLREATALYAAAEWKSAAAPRRQYGRGRIALGFAGAVALVVLALGFPALHRQPSTHFTTAQTAPVAQSTISDEALLNGIRNDLSATVPVAMRPLATYGSNAAHTAVRRKD